MKKTVLAIFLLSILTGILFAFLVNFSIGDKKKTLTRVKPNYKVFVSDIDWELAWHAGDTGRISGTAKIAIFTNDGRFYFGDNCFISFIEFQNKESLEKKYTLNGCRIYQGNWQNEENHSYISDSKYSRAASDKTIGPSMIIMPEDSEIMPLKLIFTNISKGINDEWIPNLIETEYTDSYSKETRKLKFVSSIYEFEFIENILQN